MEWSYFRYDTLSEYRTTSGGPIGGAVVRDLTGLGDIVSPQMQKKRVAEDFDF
jgi:hypothetical protein